MAFWVLFKSIPMTDDRVQQRIDTAMAELSVYERKVGSFSKPYAFVCAKEMKPSAWWAMFGKCVPVIRLLLNACCRSQLCAAGAENNRSIYGSIKTKGRSRLDHCHDGGQDGLSPRDAQAHAGEADGTLQAAGCNLA